MRLSSILSSSAVLAALGLVMMGGCGGSLDAEEDSFDSTLRDEELNAAPAQNGQAGANGKITLCHVPPGNPANAHTITVGGPAWNGHRNHKGDYLGPCQGAGGPDGGTPPPPPPPPPTDPGTPDAGTPPPPPPPPGPTCAPAGGACGGTVTCCEGLQCSGSTCEPIIG